jgi:hypothetical protein
VVKQEFIPYNTHIVGNNTNNTDISSSSNNSNVNNSSFIDVTGESLISGCNTNCRGGRGIEEEIEDTQQTNQREICIDWGRALSANSDCVRHIAQACVGVLVHLGTNITGKHGLGNTTSGLYKKVRS